VLKGSFECSRTRRGRGRAVHVLGCGQELNKRL
jgi:hypothetical protein